MGGTGANLNQQGGNNNSNSGVHWGGGSGSGNGGREHGSQTGWGWSKTNNPDVPPYVDDNGQVRITITNGLVKTPVYGVPGAGGNSDVQGGYIPENPNDEVARKWDKNNLPREIDVSIDGFKYRVTLNDNGRAIGILRTGVRPYVGSEKAKAGIMDKVDHKTPEEIYEALGFNNEEPQRQNQAKKAAYDVFYSFSMNRDRIQSDVLNKTAEVISDIGNKVGDYLGDAYKSLAREIADDVKNFQGKTIRSYDDAMASLNKVLSNPGFKFNRADSDALANVWRSIDAQDMANKLGNISKAFKFADVVMKVEKVREKSIEGYETGNWGPLMLEVESWVLSGIASAVALGVFSATLGAYALSLGAPAIAVGIVGILLAAVVGALIDDKFADALNNEIIKPAH
uniref:colicin-like pore-forming protein n=1 Tax=Escherichia coli TaxID=562 RepID=UPI001CDAFA28|nr:colicin-like pore-forming protein [Escherichia coli]